MWGIQIPCRMGSTGAAGFERNRIDLETLRGRCSKRRKAHWLLDDTSIKQAAPAHGRNTTSVRMTASGLKKGSWKKAPTGGICGTCLAARILSVARVQCVTFGAGRWRASCVRCWGRQVLSTEIVFQSTARTFGAAREVIRTEGRTHRPRPLQRRSSSSRCSNQSFNGMNCGPARDALAARSQGRSPMAGCIGFSIFCVAFITSCGLFGASTRKHSGGRVSSVTPGWWERGQHGADWGAKPRVRGAVRSDLSSPRSRARVMRQSPLQKRKNITTAMRKRAPSVTTRQKNKIRPTKRSSQKKVICVHVHRKVY